MKANSALIVCALVNATMARAGGVFELVPAEPGPYMAGQAVTVEVWLHNEETFGIDLRLLGLDIQGMRGRLFAGGEFVSSGGTTAYEYEVGYDSHRRVNSIVNRFQPGGGNLQTLAAYGFSHDANGNPLTQTVADGMAGFMADDRAFTVDRLNRLTGTEYFENGQIESTTFDLVGNRESHTDRTGAVTAYGTVNTANEYPTIGGIAVTYDAAGNLTVDQAGRQYSYDEHNRLKQVKDIGNTVLANYTYDALGRRITFNDPVAATTTRYYYDGQTAIEERNAADTRVRYHVNGSQYIDERVATFTQATSQFAYYLGSNNFSITGTGNADGSIVERLDYSSTGDFAGGGPGASAFYHDADDDLDIDLRDVANFQNCFDPTPPVVPACAPVHDFDTTVPFIDGDIDLTDYARFVGCSNGPFVTPDQACGIPQRAGVTPSSGVFTLHGRPVDILSDGHAILDYRARLYDPVLGRFLQRDPLRYSDGPSLYEAFRSNSLRFSDPFGRQAEEPGTLETLVEFFRRFQSGADPFTGEDLVDRALRRAGAVAEPNPYRRAFLEQVDLYQDVTIASIEAAEPVVARGVGVGQTVGGVVEAGTGVVLVVGSEGLGAAPGTIFVLHGVDVTQAGFRQVISGRFTPTETYSVIAEAGYPNAALVVDVGISLSSGISAAGLAVESVPLRALPSVTRVSPPASLVSEFPAISQTGEVNLLNVARRGIPLTTAEATAGLVTEPVEAFPRSTRFFQERILRDLIRYGQFRDRYGNLATRIETVNQITLLESSGLTPRLEFRVPAPTRASGSIFVDIAGLNAQRVPVRFIEIVKAHDPAYETVRRTFIRNAFPGATVEFVVSAP